MSEKIATLIGATGLVGGELLSLLLDDDYFKKVRVLIRRPLKENLLISAMGIRSWWISMRAMLFFVLSAQR